ncbi:MAG: hypothetical protein ACK5IC_01615 [Moheibacter sp.]
MSKNLMTFLLPLLIINSCTTFRDIETEREIIILTKNNLELLNGKYNNQNYIPPISAVRKTFSSNNNGVGGAIGEHFIELQVLSPKKINANIWIENSVVKTFKLRGKIKNGYFELRRKNFVFPLIYVNIFQNSKFRIGILKNMNIITDYREIEFGTVYFLSPFSNNYETLNSVHPRKHR